MGKVIKLPGLSPHRRASKPAFTRAEIELLVRLPYEEPGAVCSIAQLQKQPSIYKRNARLAAQLVEEGLLEQLPSPRGRLLMGRFRCTELGVYVAQAWARAGWLGPELKKRWMLAGQSARATEFL
jgi:hypothetical protein